jgi:tRNA(Ile2) C34 agmatinyltransferase TiaS
LTGKVKFDRFKFRRCPQCRTDVHGCPWVCPNCGWNSESRDRTFVMGDLVVRMAGLPEDARPLTRPGKGEYGGGLDPTD